MKSNGKNLHIFGLYPDVTGVGGIQEASRLTITALEEISSRYGWSTHIFSLNDKFRTRTVTIRGDQVPLDGFGRAKLRFAFHALARSRNTTGVVIAAHPNFSTVAQMMKWSARGLKTIVMSHGVEVWKRLPSYRRFSLLAAQAVLAPSSYTARKLIELQNVPPERIRLLPWPASPELVRRSSSSPRITLRGIFPEGRVILSVGRWAASERYKGADELIQAFARLKPSFPELCLVLVGGGDDLPRLRQISTGLGVMESVRFLQGLSQEQLGACYSKSEIFALPSTGEGFGFVFLEAMAFGKPVVAADAGGSPDLVQNNINGLLVPPNDVAALTQVLERLLRDDSLRERLGTRGFQFVRQSCSFDNFQSRLEQVLLSVV